MNKAYFKRAALLILTIITHSVANGQYRISDSTIEISNRKDIQYIIACYQKHKDPGEVTQKMRQYNDVAKILLLANEKEKVLKAFDAKSFQDYYFLCYMGNLPDSVVNAGMKSHTAPLIFKAKYGDTSSYNHLLKMIENFYFKSNEDKVISEDISEGYRYISYLLLLNTKKSKQLFYRIIESEKYTEQHLYDGRQNYKTAMAYVAINYYLFFNPVSKPISKVDNREFEVYEGHPVLKASEINRVEFRKYVYDFEQYLYKKEKHKINIRTKFFNLGEYRIEKYLSYPKN